MTAIDQTERDRYLAFAFAGADLLIELDQQGRVTFAAGGLRSLAGIDEAQALGQPFLALISDRDATLVEFCMEQLKRTPRVGPVQVRFAHGREPVLMRAIRPLGDGLVRLAILALLPGATIEEGEVDEVTGLLGAESFEQLVDRHLASARQGRAPAELSLIELTGLDSQADADVMGDFMRHVGGLLRSMSLDGRAAGRLGDGKFGLVHRRGDADAIESKVAALAETKQVAGIAVAVKSVDIGRPTLSDSEACKALGHVMRAFAGKVEGEIGFETLDEALQESFADTARRIDSFRSTVQSLRFQLNYQPIVNLKDRRISHLEVLSRFKGMESPYEMITFAENLGITQDFDIAVVRKAIEQLEIATDQRQRPKFAINLSVRSLDQDGFVQELLNLLARSGTIGKHISFEITESAEIRNLERMAKVIERLQSHGHAVALDDFGAGAAAFHYIRALKVDAVKVDGIYVKRLLVDERDASIAKAMIEMCHSLGVASIAEMVEEADQVDLLKSMGVQFAQGYYFARPAPTIREAGILIDHGGGDPPDKATSATARPAVQPKSAA